MRHDQNSLCFLWGQNNFKVWEFENPLATQKRIFLIELSKTKMIK